MSDALNAPQDPQDPYLWLEDVDSDAALAWVRERNAESQAELTARPEYQALQPQLLALLNDRARIPAVARRGEFFYNFWQDADHPRGLWRRTPLASYRTAEPVWDTLLDLDALGAIEGENWVWKGASVLAPERRRALLSLSRGGADATVVREFDLVTRAFVSDGFTLPEAKSDVSWLDEDTLLVGTDFGSGSLTDSGYPRLVKRWRRGTPLTAAETLFEGQASDVSAWASVERAPGLLRVCVGRSVDFYTTEAFLLDDPQAAAPALQRLDKPDDASLDLHQDWALLQLRSDGEIGGTARSAGTLLASPAEAYLRGAPQWQALFTPTPTCSLDHYDWTRHALLLNVMDQVANRVEVLRWDAAAQTWQRQPLALPGPGTLSLQTLHDPWTADDALAEATFVSYADFLTPDSLLLCQIDQPDQAPEVVKQRPGHFDATGMRAEQRFATSADGTRVPYFVVWPAGVTATGDNPTLLYGYGGFEVSMQPWYSGAFGLAWYQRGGVLVVANIRGGGEFGPDWHQAAIKATKQRSYDDFIAVAEDLVATGVTRPARLGIMGGSNGGLLVGAAFTQRPELFGAVVCQVPLLDMRRYHRLLAGASWMAEYGDPDQTEEWAWISKYSPYQQLRAAADGQRYPRVLFCTSTRDDRVHPAHARKMVARLRELGHPVLYFENIEGGHGGAADNTQRAHLQALEYAYLWAELMSAP
jgi:prolyl oligopeptidase